MIKNNKWKTVISSVFILLPALIGLLLWDKLSDMTSQWNTDGTASGLSAKIFFIFGLPMLLLALHFVCLIFTSMDKKQKDQSKKALGMVFWIVPVISFFINGFWYSVALGNTPSFFIFIPIMFGIIFIFTGNYFPKIKQNHTLGIRIYWTINNEENWNRTHRFGGKLWVICGLILLLSAFLPGKLIILILSCVICAAVAVPIIYSYLIYRAHKKEGIIYETGSKSKIDKITAKFTAVFLPVLLIAIIILMFTGNINIYCEDTRINIDASYWNDMTLDYSQIDSVEYREDLNAGQRINGFGSSRLQMGAYANKEFGPYIRYTYTENNAYIVLKSDGKVLVIGSYTDADTRLLYEQICSKLEN